MEADDDDFKSSKRRLPRLEVTPKAEIYDGDLRFKALLQDINDEGLAFVCARHWPPGKLLDMTIYLPQGIVTAEIEVRHSTELGTGAKFTYMDNISRTAYNKFTDEFFHSGAGSWFRREI